MAKNHQNLNNIQRMLFILEEMHQWELENMGILRTMTGRHVYLSLASKSFNQESSGINLKSIKNNNHYTDKAISIRLEKLQKMNVIRKFKINDDARTKIITPEEKLHALWETHSDAFYRIISKYYTLIPK